MPVGSYVRVIAGYNALNAKIQMSDWIFTRDAQPPVIFQGVNAIYNFESVYVVFVNDQKQTGTLKYDADRVYDAPPELYNYSIFSQVITMGCGMTMLAIAFCFFEGKNCFRFFWNKVTGKNKKKVISNEEDQEYDPEDNQGSYGEERGDTNEEDDEYEDSR